MVKALSNTIAQFSKGEPVASTNEISHISSTTTIRGEVVSNGNMRIDGNVEGKISSSGHLTIGEMAVINGDIECATVDFRGSIVGNLYVNDVLCLKNTASVEGDINTRKLQVELGARINGSCHMYKKEEPAYPSAPEPEAE